MVRRRGGGGEGQATVLFTATKAHIGNIHISVRPIAMHKHQVYAKNETSHSWSK